MNERLRSAISQRGLSVDRLAERCKVDPKTVARWITSGRVPHPRQRKLTAEVLGLSEDFLWPTLKERATYLAQRTPDVEIVGTYADRSSVPRDMWVQLTAAAERNIDVLVFSGTFLAQTNPRLPQMLLDRAAAGVKVRLCFGDPTGNAVALRDQEEGLHSTLGPKIRASLSYFTPLVEGANCGIRLHNTTLYASIFRYDDHMMVNPHVWGSPASANPLLHIRRVGEENMFDKYITSFTRVWEQAKPWYPTP